MFSNIVLTLSRVRFDRIESPLTPGIASEDPPESSEYSWEEAVLPNGVFHIFAAAWSEFAIGEEVELFGQMAVVGAEVFLIPFYKGNRRFLEKIHH